MGKFKRIDIVVNNAGLLAEDNIRKTTLPNVFCNFVSVLEPSSPSISQKQT
jgi:NAD(P)-dependent dehydrogenase (short-subunit alcohol dehydrogenase family)